MPRVRLIGGTARSDRARRMDELLLERLDTSLLIVPTGAYARRRAAGLLARTGRAALLDPPVIAFGELVERILQHSPLRAKRISPLEERIVVSRAVAHARAAGSLKPLGDAGDSEGFLDHLLNVIAQIKQAAIEPMLFVQRVGRRHTMDGIVAAVYTAYQDELKRAGAVDLPGMYWLARIECEGAARPAGLRGIRRLLVDDFDDFTPSEFGVIAAIARHVDELAFGVNMSADPEQGSLYALPIRTMQKIRERFENVEIVEPVIEGSPLRTSAFISASLLVRKESAVAKDLQRDIAFLECYTLEHEIESIARRIKGLVRDMDVALPEIAVVWRNTAAVAAPMREIFGEFGIPLSGLESRTLGESAIAGFVLRFLDAAQTWSPAGVLDVVTSPWFIGPGARHAAAFPILARAARPGASLKGWGEALERLHRYLDDPRQIELQRLLEHVPEAREACAVMKEAFDRFAGHAKQLLRMGTFAAFADALSQAIKSWPLAAATAGMPDDGVRALEETALPALEATLATLKNGHGAGAERISCETFARMLRQAFGATLLSTPAVTGGVACLGMEPARYLSFEYVFLAGMTDESVPEKRALSAIYPDDDRARLSAAGVPLDHAVEHDAGEILLFQRMFGIARRSIVLSWHRITRGGAAVQRSLYVNEIADQLGELEIEMAESPRDALVPPAELAACERDVQNIAAEKLPGAFPEIAAATEIERARYGDRPFGTHDGVLSDADTLAKLRTEFGSAHEFSPSQLETYADCPFRFFQERVLRLFSIDAPEQAFDRLARGLVLHGALERFHRRYLGKTLDEIPPGEATAAMQACAEEVFDATAARFRNLSPGVIAAERARTIQTLLRHVRLQYRPPKKNGPEPWPPALIEASFGGASDGAPAFGLDTEAGEIRLTGRIDRIDRHGGRFRLIDYKTSTPSVKRIREGKIFQLSLYTLAAESVLLPGEKCEDAYYVPIGQRKNPTPALDGGDDAARRDERIELGRAAAGRAVAGIRAGRFHPACELKACAGCPDQKVCRFERARIKRKLRA